MKKVKVIKPCIPKEERYIFTEGIDYSKTGKASIWGKGDKDTIELLKKIEMKGKWLNLCAGDGRYNLELLQKADFVLASDIDESALSKLWHNTPDKFKTKLQTEVFDVTRRFPLENKSFDGIFCMGVLHLFPKDILEQIIAEIGRILKPSGKVIIDFCADLKRTSLEGKPLTFGKEPLYTLKDAKIVLKTLFKEYKIKMYASESIDHYKEANPPYTMDCKFIILIADKRREEIKK